MKHYKNRQWAWVVVLCMPHRVNLLIVNKHRCHSEFKSHLVFDWLLSFLISMYQTNWTVWKKIPKINKCARNNEFSRMHYTCITIIILYQNSILYVLIYRTLWMLAHWPCCLHLKIASTHFSSCAKSLQLTTGGNNSFKNWKSMHRV